MEFSELRSDLDPVVRAIGYYAVFALATGVTAVSVLDVIRSRSGEFLGDAVVDTIYTLHVLDTLLLLGPLTGILTGIYLNKALDRGGHHAAVFGGMTGLLGFGLFVTILATMVGSQTDVTLLQLPRELGLVGRIAVPTAVVAALSGFVGVD